MKKLGLLIFTAALAVGVISAVSCSIGGIKFNNVTGVQGSGNAKTETRSVSGFEKINANGAVNMEIAVGKDFSVTVEADDNILEHIKTETNGDTLRIYSEGRLSTKTKINVKISMPELSAMDINGASTAIVSNANSDSLELKANGASKIKIDGQVKDLDANANGASTIDAETLKAENADVDSNGASTVTVFASNDLKADASGASTIYYAGEPENIKQSSSGASSIKKK